MWGYSSLPTAPALEDHRSPVDLCGTCQVSVVAGGTPGHLKWHQAAIIRQLDQDLSS